MVKPGQIVLYKLTSDDEQRINRQRSCLDSTEYPINHGGTMWAGNECPLIVVRVWQDEFGPGLPGVNGQVILDGNDRLWVASVGQGSGFGQWQPIS